MLETSRGEACSDAENINDILHVQIAEKVGIPNLYLHENVEDAELTENTGVIIWPSGVRLGQHLVRNRNQELKGAKVLEVGSGTGASFGTGSLCKKCMANLLVLSCPGHPEGC